jgi:histidinol-phosphate aminotransferase
MELLDKKVTVQKWVKLLIAEREKMEKLLAEFPFVVKVYPSEANFLLVKMHDARGIYNYLVEEGIIVRDRSKVHLCDESLRITIGNSEENENLLCALKKLI